MEIFINNEKIDFNFNEQELIGSAVNTISSKLKKENRVLCQIKIDNVTIPEAKENEIFSFPLGSIKQMDLKAETVENLVLNSLESLNLLLPELIKAINKTADLHREGDERAAKNLFFTTLEAMEIVPAILTNIRATMNLEFEHIKHGDSNLKGLEEGMLSAISLIYEAQKNEDYVTLADVLEYELSPNLSSWFDAIPVLKKRCNGKD